MQKLKLQTPNRTKEHIEKIAQLFPNVVSEGKVDFDLLRQMLSEELVEGADERYRLDWVGKRASLLKANLSINKTLRPCPKESVEFDTTENLYIEGDNFEVLKLIQESYLGKVKMIYIDPPYNTGKDFVYRDNFTASKEEYEDEMGLRDEEENKLFKNTDSNGRFHSDWLSMMYERLLVSRDLLKDDGVIFISIDDNEVHNLRKICDEVFGESNFIANICHKARASVSNDKIISSNHNHILLYAKDESIVFANRKKFGLNPNLDGFNKEDEKGKYKYTPVDGPGGERKGNPYYTFEGVTGYFRYSEKSMREKFEKGIVVKVGNGLQQKYYLEDAKNRKKTDTTWWDDKLYTSTATSRLKKLMGGDYFTNPKNIELLKRILTLSTEKNDLVLDFFSGSSSTAHAVMQLNAEDQGERKFIMVQLPEKTDEKSEAYKAGYKTIAEIGKERIRRAGTKINEELKAKNEKLVDVGFRVLKVDSSNMKDVYYHPTELKQSLFQEEEAKDNIKADRTPLDLLFATMLELGIELSLKITPHSVDGATLYALENNELVACFDENISLKVIDAIKALSPYQVVLRDGSFESDSDKINAIESLSKVATVSVM